MLMVTYLSLFGRQASRVGELNWASERATFKRRMGPSANTPRILWTALIIIIFAIALRLIALVLL